MTFKEFRDFFDNICLTIVLLYKNVVERLFYQSIQLSLYLFTFILNKYDSNFPKKGIITKK
jgi:hypothetical protein